MTLMRPIIPEDAWVGLYEFRRRRLHKVFATNGDVLTHCNRWLKRELVTLADDDNGGVRCHLCEAAA